MKVLKKIETGMVPVYETDTGEKVVYGTELYECLGSKRKYTDWIKSRFMECDAIENEDYQAFSQNCEKPSGGRPKHDCIIRLDTAKEMAMLERNEKGRKISRYLDAIERRKIMDSKISMFKNEDLDLEMRTILNDDGSISINAEDVARGLGWTTVAKSGNEVVRWARMNGYCKEFGFSPLVGENDYIPESLFYMLAMKANNERAQGFQKWIAIDVVPAIRKTGSYGVTNREVRSFMEKQLHFNQEILQKINDIQSGKRENIMIDSVSDCVEDENETVRRRKMLNQLVRRMAKARGWDKNFALHRLYKALENALDISLDDYMEVHQAENGNMNISTLGIILEYDRLYKTAVRLCANTISSMKC